MNQTDRDALIERLPSLLEPDQLHPIGCSSWDDEAAVFIKMVRDYLLASSSQAPWPEDVVRQKASDTAGIVCDHFLNTVMDWTDWHNLSTAKRVEIGLALRSVVVAEVESALATLSPPACNCEDAQPYKDALSDLLACRDEQEAIGGGPGWQERDRKAWAAAEELMRIEP